MNFKFFPLVFFLLLSSCIQTSQELNGDSSVKSSTPKNSPTKVFTKNNSANQKINLVFNTQHEPIYSLQYVTFTIVSEDIRSIEIQGSSNKNITFVSRSENSIKHLVHPMDQALNVSITKLDGSTVSVSYSLDLDEVVL